MHLMHLDSSITTICYKAAFAKVVVERKKLYF